SDYVSQRRLESLSLLPEEIRVAEGSSRAALVAGGRGARPGLVVLVVGLEFAVIFFVLSVVLVLVFVVLAVGVRIGFWIGFRIGVGLGDRAGIGNGMGATRIGLVGCLDALGLGFGLVFVSF